ncbi:hypothetical protein DYB26_011847, partial [Aphanomyces astaci]
NAPPAPDTGLEADRQQVPHLVRDWLLHDMDRPDEVTHAFQTPEGTTWDTYHYDEDIQARCERSLRTRVSPEHGGVHRNSGSPACIRDRERVIINLILRTGLVPPILGRKQMIYLCKIGHSQGVVNLDPGLPAWHPITVQSAFSSRIFTQGAPNRTISSLLFVDDTLDISTSYAGIQPRAGISNYFTGQSASGSVFGADKSFLFYPPHAHTRTLPLMMGLAFHNPFAHSQRLYHFQRIANDRDSPTHDLLMESLEAYQLNSGLTDHPPAFRIPPPAADATLLGTILRDLAIFKPALTITALWHQPADSLPLHPNDRPIWAYLTPALGTTLISINRLHAKKVRWVGDITNDKGTILLSLASNLPTKFDWTSLTLQRFAPIWDAIPCQKVTAISAPACVCWVWRLVQRPIR